MEFLFDGMIYINTPSKVPMMTYIQQLVIPTDTTNIYGSEAAGKYHAVFQQDSECG